MSAEPRANISAATAQHAGNIDPPGNREVSTTAIPRRSNRDCRSATNCEGSPPRQRAEFRPAEGDHGVVEKLQLWPDEREFERCLVLAISHQEICHAQRE